MEPRRKRRHVAEIGHQAAVTMDLDGARGTQHHAAPGRGNRRQRPCLRCVGRGGGNGRAEDVGECGYVALQAGDVGPDRGVDRHAITHRFLEDLEPAADLALQRGNGRPVGQLGDGLCLCPDGVLQQRAMRAIDVQYAHVTVRDRTHTRTVQAERERRDIDRETEKQTERQTDRQTDRRTDRQTDRRTGRQADRQTGRQSQREKELALGVRG